MLNRLGVTREWGADTETDILVANAELNLTMMPGQKVKVDSIRFPNFAFEYLVTDYTEMLRTEHLKAAWAKWKTSLSEPKFGEENGSHRNTAQVKNNPLNFCWYFSCAYKFSNEILHNC